MLFANRDTTPQTIVLCKLLLLKGQHYEIQEVEHLYCFFPMISFPDLIPLHIFLQLSFLSSPNVTISHFQAQLIGALQ